MRWGISICICDYLYSNQLSTKWKVLREIAFWWMIGKQLELKDVECLFTIVNKRTAHDFCPNRALLNKTPIYICVKYARPTLNFTLHAQKHMYYVQYVNFMWTSDVFHEQSGEKHACLRGKLAFVSNLFDFYNFYNHWRSLLLFFWRACDALNIVITTL